jgi:hypothetical protein
MKTKLVKQGDRWVLYNEDGSKMALSTESPYNKLSKENCDDIFGVVDVDKFSHEHCDRLYHEGDINWERYRIHFKEGFNKAMELNKDKLFTEYDLRKAYQKGEEDSYTKGGQTKEMENQFIQSLQQTEWDVEIELVCPHPLDTYICGMQYGCDGDGCNHPNQIPYLDKDGCLILKRI